MPDYRTRILALRRLGAEGSGATPAERELANRRAKELEDKYCNGTSPIADDTTVTSRDGSSWTRMNWQTVQDLYKQQYRWNQKYYDQNGKPKPGYGEDDEEWLEYAYDNWEDADDPYALYDFDEY